MEDGNVEQVGRRVTLSRKESDKPWGFSMAGGHDQGCTLYISKVNPRSLAEKCGLARGDAVLRIQDMSAPELSHDEAKAEILRAGNELRLVIQRGHVPKEEIPLAHRRSLVLEEKTEYRGDPNPTTQSRTFVMLNQFLESELDAMERDKAKDSSTPQPENAPIHGSLYAKKDAKNAQPVADSPTKKAVEEQSAAAAAASTKRVRSREAAKQAAGSRGAKAASKVETPAAKSAAAPAETTATVKVESPASTPKAQPAAPKKVENPAAKKVETPAAKKVETPAEKASKEVVVADNGPVDAAKDGPSGDSEATVTISM